MEERKRKVDIEKLSYEQAAELSEQIGFKVQQILAKANEEANRVLKIYSMKCELNIKIGPLETAE